MKVPIAHSAMRIEVINLVTYDGYLYMFFNVKILILKHENLSIENIQQIIIILKKLFVNFQTEI